MSEARNGWRRIKDDYVLGILKLGGADDPWLYQKEVEDGHLTVFVGPEPAGYHMSISHRTNWTRVPGRYPTWDEIVEARYQFCPANMTMVMHLPPKEEYVNVHDTTFHLWELT
jgi:hypothetical protein